MKTKERLEARELREKGMSLKEISDIVGVSKGTISVWVRDIQLSPEQKKVLKDKRPQMVLCGDDSPIRKKSKGQRRCWQNNGRIRALEEPNGAFRDLTMLYWCEGTKGRNSLTFANTDPDLLSYYWKLVNEVFGDQRESVVLTLNCHLDCGLILEKIENYWLDLLDIPRTALRKHIVNYGRDYYRKGESSSRKLPYGCCTLAIHSTEIVQTVYGAIKGYVGIEDEDKWLG